jgi:hypothetical protein
MGRSSGKFTPLVQGKSLNDSDAVIRRVPAQPSMMTKDRKTGVRRPSSGAFMPDDDGISVYSVWALGKCRLDDAVARKKDSDSLATVPVSQVRGLRVPQNSQAELDVVGDPWPTHDDPADEHPRDAAHSLITGLGDLSRKAQRAFQQELAKVCAVASGAADQP